MNREGEFKRTGAPGILARLNSGPSRRFAGTLRPRPRRRRRPVEKFPKKSAAATGEMRPQEQCGPQEKCGPQEQKDAA